MNGDNERDDSTAARGRLGSRARAASGAGVSQLGTRLISLGLFIAILVLWEIAGRNKLINPFFLSWPSAIGIEAWKMLENGELMKNLWVTGYAYFIGVVAACVAGSVLGLAMGWWRTFGAVIDPYVVFFSAMPRVALFPVLLMIFGIGDVSRILIVFIGVVTPIIFNAYIGAKQTPPLLVDAARVFGYNKRQLFRVVVLPAALPYLIAGFRTGVTLGMIMIVVAEFFGASSGLGQKIAITAQLYQTPQMYAWVLYTSIVALVLVRAADWFERWAMRWA
jgi:ABC-type nitrate/sulfonate/bicarbonate transport system permease component